MSRGLQRPMVDRMPLFVDVSTPRSGTGDVFGQISPRRRGGRSHQGKSFRVEETAAIPARRRALVRFVGRRVGRETRPATARPCGVPRPGRGPRVALGPYHLGLDDDAAFSWPAAGCIASVTIDMFGLPAAAGALASTPHGWLCLA